MKKRTIIILILMVCVCMGIAVFWNHSKSSLVPASEVQKTVLSAIAQKIDLKKLEPDMRLIWISEDEAGKKIRPVLVRIGMSDGTYTEIKEILFGEIKEGEFVVTGRATAEQINTRTPDLNQAFRSLR
ncbi:MAG TPA: hypothetical protein PLX73_02260 [Candidatus Paceibacterota bacterium]|nr:hypothetical protein [Candidatus Paceibacterota bacterium]HOL53892.1 hypothetical protein [Candidatus Paceibacterota bacterium]HPP17181.1 hypothetical protein [Candidatus Paceibacterota bacterium]